MNSKNLLIIIIILIFLQSVYTQEKKSNYCSRSDYKDFHLKDYDERVRLFKKYNTEITKVMKSYSESQLINMYKDSTFIYSADGGKEISKKIIAIRDNPMKAFEHYFHKRLYWLYRDYMEAYEMMLAPHKDTPKELLNYLAMSFLTDYSSKRIIVSSRDISEKAIEEVLKDSNCYIYLSTNPNLKLKHIQQILEKMPIWFHRNHYHKWTLRNLINHKSISEEIVKDLLEEAFQANDDKTILLANSKLKKLKKAEKK